ncbi:glycosyltransferase [Cytophagaceae bacterium ABcell3]|nr:glycosyltransferase [Cytophagaceae bacterium ABcell3]
MNRKKIFLASVLKPVNEARMYEKFAKSLADYYEVHVAGHEGKNKNIHKNIYLYPLFQLTRLSFDRFFAPWKIYQLMVKIKPQLVVACTHELLIAACFYKLFHKTKLVYDVQENYYFNIKYTQTFPLVIRNILACYVRAKEKLCGHFIDHFILAEKCYEEELPFLRTKYTVIENKYRPLEEEAIQPVKKSKTINLLYSGTISLEYGIFEAVNLAKKLYEVNNSIRLTIIGWSAKEQTAKALRKEIEGVPFINLITDHKPVPHQKIIKEISQADFGLLSYRPNKSTCNRLPTKLFEYTAHKLPMLINKNPKWESLSKAYNSAILLDYHNFDPNHVLGLMSSTTFYDKGDTNQVLWKTEEQKLYKTINHLLNP